jgi:hypothetical protein
MYPMLTNLFNKNLNLSERTPIDFPLRKHHEKKCEKFKQQLEGVLDDDAKKLLKKIMEESNAESSYSDIDSFITGFRLATLLMVEVFHDKDNLIEKI